MKGERKSMVTRYRRNSALFTFMIDENEAGTGYKPYIILVKTPDDETQPETITRIPVKELNGYSIRINRKSISAANGSRGVFSFIRDCIRNNFMMVYVNRICEQFTN